MPWDSAGDGIPYCSGTIAVVLSGEKTSQETAVRLQKIFSHGMIQEISVSGKKTKKERKK